MNSDNSENGKDRRSDTTIRITDDVWSRLNARKGRGDSFNDVVATLLDVVEEQEED